MNPQSRKKEKVYTEAEYNEAWRKGYDTAMRMNDKYVKFAKAIIEPLYEFFETRKEDD